ncbi:hypothetical protein FRC11_012218 [Ceratobasidium sp. 423]|nr:hypothetical protein FRC11_012218 [Ceratobasidium sp. 423]
MSTIRTEVLAGLIDALDDEWYTTFDQLEQVEDVEADNDSDLFQAEPQEMQSNSTDTPTLCEATDVRTMHEKILQSLEDDDRLFFIRGVEPEIFESVDDIDKVVGSLFGLVMEPRLDEELDTVEGRGQNAYQVRKPYTVSCALRKTNWFERSFEWENSDFRQFYR